MTCRRAFVAWMLLPLLAVAVRAQAPAPAPSFDLTGTWTSSFDTQIGTQNYTYEFAMKDGKLTGKATSDLGGESVLKDVKLDKDVVTFGETLKFMDMEIAITYSGKFTSADEIKFTRNVAEFATEELVAKRAKK